ncbi:hypothetical protein BU23DRAFT_642080 [Bimuria novae-zelandiae CBS 107.79]|uniref:RING-type domain-containing protein n=1 Tax=Bimuria novae-zelandiae CBS 107.79 TaxID=1447943 RepID=A0A6A5VQ65_9PLEO|nr:hypothetical protein BU23DRAFT_642080 [Bimuria novae-zelandiae CBS 107.79]
MDEGALNMSPMCSEKLKSTETEEQLAEYECWVCTLSYTFDKARLGVLPGPMLQTDRSRLLEAYLDPDIVEKYKAKYQEYSVPKLKLTFCHCCTKWQPPSGFIDTQRSTYAACSCGTNTCVGCKGKWEDDNRRYSTTIEKLDWMPNYTQDCRIKPCPACCMWVELKQGCNHMTCDYCRREFCFQCMIEWNRLHESCGYIGDPFEGYDYEGYDYEGYENTRRGLHIYSGLNRQGLNRLGKRLEEQKLAEINGDGREGYDDFGDYNEEEW